MEIGWIDYSKEERNKIISILNLLSSREALDELGIGSIRDAFSDMMFPGISVLQTRAKYFLIIPYMFNDACQRSQTGKLHSGHDVRTYIDKCEDNIVNTLITNSGSGAKGIIGSRNYYQNKTVSTKPSAIYWNGIRTLGILVEPSFSIDNASNAIYRKGRLHSKTERKNETEETGADDSDILKDGFVIFNSITPDYPYMNDSRIELTNKEAEYLKNRMLHATGTKDSALAYFLRNPKLLEKYSTFQDFDYHDFSGDLADAVRLAREFADFIYGPHLLYNIIFADGCGYESGDITSIKEEFDEYVDSYKSPSVDEIITKTSAKYLTAEFIRNFDIAMSTGDVLRARQLVIQREIEVKKKRSKLLRPSEYQYTQPIHYFKLSYRFDTAKTILMDIITGMENSHD